MGKYGGFVATFATTVASRSGPNVELLAFHRDGLQFEVPANQQ